MWDIKGFGYVGCTLFVPQVLCLEYKTSVSIQVNKNKTLFAIKNMMLIYCTYNQ